MPYRRSGNSGLRLPAFSLGLWHNFGDVDSFITSRDILLRGFDLGVTHIDLANNYGPPPGSAEETFGRVLESDLRPYRDELIVSTKAGYDMWPGPYGEWGSRKYLLASLDQSLRRMKLAYVDIFYSHRPDPRTPLEETMSALHQAVHSGRALYAGISNYSVDQTREAIKMLRSMGTPCLIHQVQYSMFRREPEEGLLEALGEEGVGCIAFSPLAQGLLTDRYLHGLPGDSRAVRSGVFLKTSDVTDSTINCLQSLHKLAEERGQTLAQMALAWTLRDSRVTSVIVGASKVEQLEQNISALQNPQFSEDELNRIDKILIRKTKTS